MLIVYITISKN